MRRLVVLLAALAAGRAAAGLDLVRDGKPVATIVTPAFKDATAAEARFTATGATWLRDYGMRWDVTMSSSGTAVHYILNDASLYASIIYTKPQYHSAESRGALMRSHCVWHQMDEATGLDAGVWYKYKE